jgi:hypothetical protein
MTKIKRKKITQKFAYQDFFYIFVKLKNKAGWWPKTPGSFSSSNLNCTT